MIEFSFHGLDLGSRGLINGLQDSQVFVANGTVNEMIADALISMDLQENGRFMAHEVEFLKCAFSCGMRLTGSSDRPADVYLDDVEMSQNSGCMLEATEVNAIISSLTAKENTNFTIVATGSTSITNSVVSYNSGDAAMLQITGIDSRQYRLPTPSDMVYISSCDFARYISIYMPPPFLPSLAPPSTCSNLGLAIPTLPSR